MYVLRRIRGIEELPEKKDKPACALALGSFDGLHQGHMDVLRAALSTAQPGGAGVVTFETSPSGQPGLLSAEEKVQILEEMGMQELYSFEFSGIRTLSAGDFVTGVLFDRFHARELYCGEDFRFGRDALGNTELLRKLCAANGAELFVIPTRSDGGEKISSTRIRRAVENGDIPLANRLLGRPFCYAPEVIHGNHLGTGMGTPTMNQLYPETLVCPPFGVYASLVHVEGRACAGVTNIGVKPTVGSDRVLSETWIPDFSGDLYHKRVRVELLEFIRPERKFDSLEELGAEIRKNARQAKEIVKTKFPEFSF